MVQRVVVMMDQQMAILMVVWKVSPSDTLMVVLKVSVLVVKKVDEMAVW